MSQTLIDFKDQVLKNLSTHGYPQKKISFPLEKMYEVADNKGLSFNKVLELLKEEGHGSETTVDKVVFFPLETEEEDVTEMFSQAQDMMENMTPDQLQNIQEMILGMSKDDREDLLKKGKDMGLI